LDRARLLERLTSALVALEEPFRTVVVRRYLDDESAADIARSLGVPAGTVRWRLKTGLERLRAELDAKTPRRQWVPLLAPALSRGATLVKTKTLVAAAIALLVLIGGVIAVVVGRAPAKATVANATARPAAVPITKAAPARITEAAPAPPPGQ